MKKKIAAAPALVIILLMVFAPALSATDYEDFGEEYEQMLDGIPEDIRELLPDGIFSDNPDEIYGAVSEISGFPYILRTVASLAGLRLGSALRLFALLLGLLVLSALLRSVRELIKSPALSQAVSLCSMSAILAAVVSVQYEMLSAILRFLDQFNFLVNSMIPIMGVLYAMGGNVSAAVANNSAMMVF